MMKKINIALLAGGDSSEREIALDSAGQIGQALDGNKYNVYLIDVNGRSWSCGGVQVDKNDFSLTIADNKVVFDYALIIIHGRPGEDGRLQGYLDIMGVRYSSCSMVSSVITFDKELCKRVVEDCGINLAKEIFLRKGDKVDGKTIVSKLGLPLFVKPNASGSSFGVTKVKAIEELQPAIDAAMKESEEVLIEEFIAGREFGCGLIVADGKEVVLPITEIISKRDFFDHQAKYTEGMSEEITPADLEEGVASQIREMALRAYKACRCSGIVRIDFIVTEQGVPYMIEINAIPGMSAASIVPKQVEAAGITLGQLYDMVINDSCK